MQFFRFHRSGLTLAAVSLTTYSLFAQEAIPPSAEPTYVLDAGKQHELRVYPFAIAGKWGLIDEAGKTLIRAQFDSIGAFHQPYGKRSYATYFHRGKAGILHQSGNVVLAADNYDGIDHNGHLYEPVITRKANKFGMLSALRPGTLQEVLPVEYDEITSYPFGETRKQYVVRKDKLCGVASSSGEWAVPLAYDSCRIVNVGFLANTVRLVKADRIFLYTERGELREVTGLSGQALAQRLVEATEFSSSQMTVVGDPGFGEDSTGNTAQPTLRIVALKQGGFRIEYTTLTTDGQVRKGQWETKLYRKLEKFGYGPAGQGGTFRLLAQTVNGKWGLIDESGRIALPIMYDHIGEVRDGSYFAFIRQGKYWGAISERGELNLPPRYLRVAEAGAYSLFCVDAAGRKAYWANGKVHLPKEK